MTNTLDRLKKLEDYNEWLNRHYTERPPFIDLAPIKEQVGVFIGKNSYLTEIIYTSDGRFWGFRSFAPNYYGGRYFNNPYLKGEKKCPSPILFCFDWHKAPMMLAVPKSLEVEELGKSHGEKSSMAILQLSPSSKIKSFDNTKLYQLGAGFIKSSLF